MDKYWGDWNIKHTFLTKPKEPSLWFVVLTLPHRNKSQFSGVFRRETASGFYPWCNVEDPRKRVAEGLCGWRHGNLFPMTQSAQSHHQMRSIPLCPKAVFYVFVFDSIHDSASTTFPFFSKMLNGLFLLSLEQFVIKFFFSIMNWR